MANFKNKKPEIVIQSILKRIINLTEPNLKQLKYVKQLEILSILRDLQDEIITQSKNMALIFPIEKDIRFKQGKEEGETKKAILAIKALVEANVSPQKIADSLQVSLEFVKKVVDSLKK